MRQTTIFTGWYSVFYSWIAGGGLRAFVLLLVVKYQEYYTQFLRYMTGEGHTGVVASAGGHIIIS